MDDVHGTVTEICDVIDSSLMPIGSVLNGKIRVDRFDSWWIGRSIPRTRTGLRHLMESLDVSGPTNLLTKSMGLSLVDHYWIRPDGMDVSWSEVNFFDNSFSRDVGDLLFGKEIWVGEMDLISPDNTSDGMLMKCWRIVNGERCLIKAGEAPFMQEPYNEVAASIIAESMGIPHVSYDLVVHEGTVCSSCRDFIDRDTELVTAQQVVRSKTHEPGIPLYDHFLSCCSDHGLDAAPMIDRMIVFDYIIGNTDRHLNNFGVIRDSESLEWLSVAPLFDNGTSMGCNLQTEDVLSDAGCGCKPFSDHWSKQMAMVHDASWFDPDVTLHGVDKAVGVFADAHRFVETGRMDAIGEFLRSRVEDVRRFFRIP